MRSQQEGPPGLFLASLRRLGLGGRRLRPRPAPRPPPDAPLLPLPWRGGGEGAPPPARLLAQPAARAAPLDSPRHAEEVAHLLAADVQLQRVERADGDAQLAAGADAVVLDDDRLRPLATRHGGGV